MPDLAHLLEQGEIDAALAWVQQIGTRETDLAVALRRERVALSTALAIGDLAGALDLRQIVTALSDCADRSLDRAIADAIAKRVDGAESAGMRTAAEDVEIGGQQIKQGDWMMLNYVAANHDPAQFDDPRAFDASRSPNRHMAFGAGAHQCLGLHLARLQISVLFDALLDRLDAVDLAGEPARSSSTFVGGLKTLPLRIQAS